MKHMIILISFFGSLALTSQMLPDIHLVLNFCGAVSGIVIAVVMPILIYNKAFKGEISTFRLWFNWTLLVVCVLLASVSAVFTVAEILKEFF